MKLKVEYLSFLILLIFTSSWKHISECYNCFESDNPASLNPQKPTILKILSKLLLAAYASDFAWNINIALISALGILAF